MSALERVNSALQKTYLFRNEDSKNWLMNSMLAKGALVNLDQAAPIYFSTADTKYVDTTLGGNFAINPPPQWTRSADIKRRGRAPYSEGMGRAYSERIDDYSQIVHFRCGVASFNALTAFTANFYSPHAGNLARTGRGTGAIFAIGQATGFVVRIMAWKLLALQIIGKGISFLAEKGTSRFYRLKPTMPVYWQTVQSIVNQLATNLGVSPRQISQVPIDKGPNRGYEFSEADANRLREAFPGIFTAMGSIDVWALATRTTRTYISMLNKMDSSVYNEYNSGIQQNLDQMAADIKSIYFDPIPEEQGEDFTYVQYLERWLGSSAGRGTDDIKTDSEGKVIDSQVEVISSLTDEENLPSALDFYEAELYDGSAFVSFRVNYTGTVQETITNQSGESEMASSLGGYTSQAREVSFGLAGGNLFQGVQTVLGAAQSFASGVLDNFGLSGVFNAALGGAFLDIPNQWKGSMMQFTKSTYTIDLVTPYNHPMAKLMYQFIPMAMLMAMSFPRSTGKQSYYAPLLVEYYDQGRAQSRLGMIDSLTFERGITNLGFNHANRAMGVRATFSIVDMSNIMHVPISMINGGWGILAAGVFAGPAGAVAAGAANIANQIFDDDTPFNDYMAVLAGMNAADQVFTLRKAKVRATRALMNWESWTSPARLAHIAGDWGPSRVLSALFPVPNKLG